VLAVLRDEMPSNVVAASGAREQAVR
jgi:hypothetical protein